MGLYRKASFLTLLLLVWTSSLSALTLRPMSADELIDLSEHIFTAVCESRSSEFRNGNIIPTYKLRLLDVWKGKPPLQRDGTIKMEDLGGAAQGRILKDQLPQPASADAPDTITINQYVGGSANMIVGEEVLLFTHEYRLDPALAVGGATSPFSPGNLLITGRVHGRFSIVTDPATGEKHVVRPSLEARGLIPNEASMQSFLNSQQKMLEARKKSEAEDRAPRSGVSSAEAMRRLRMSPEATRQAIAQRAATGSKEGSSPNEILNFDALSDVRARVLSRLESDSGERED
jgi:hypothetical protein